MLRGSPVQTSLTLNPNSIQLRFGRDRVEVFPVSSQPRNSENGSLAARRNLSRLLGSSLQTETHIVGFLFVACNTTVQLTLPELLEHPVTPSSSKVFSPSRNPLLSTLNQAPRPKFFLACIWTMYDSEQQPWSNNPNAPKIPYHIYNYEKTYLAGILIGAMLYGAPSTLPPTRPSICAHSVCSVDSRDRRRPVLPMYDRATRPSPSQRGTYQVGTRVLHRGHVLVCDRTHRDGSPH